LTLSLNSRILSKILYRVKSVSQMSSHCYLALIRRSGAGFVATCADLPGCTAQGGSLEEVIEHMRQAMQVHVLRLQQAGLPVPESLDYEDYVYPWPERQTADTTPVAILFHV
jgi:predicted RNase H-like HicB family nuclease